MKKKLILSLLIVSIVFSIPTQRSQAIYYQSINDPQGDVVLKCSSGTGDVSPYTYPACDIKQAFKNNTHIGLILYDDPIVDRSHHYKVIVQWDTSDVNYTMCIAGGATEDVDLGVKAPASLFNGTYTIFKNSSGDTLFSSITTNQTFLQVNNTVEFAIAFLSFPALIQTALVPDSYFGSATKKTSTECYPQKSKGYCYWICDTAGSGFCWIPFPDDCGGIETPIIFGLVGSSFIALLVIQKRKKK